MRRRGWVLGSAGDRWGSASEWELECRQGVIQQVRRPRILGIDLQDILEALARQLIACRQEVLDAPIELLLRCSPQHLVGGQPCLPAARGDAGERGDGQDDDGKHAQAEDCRNRWAHVAWPPRWSRPEGAGAGDGGRRREHQCTTSGCNRRIEAAEGPKPLVAVEDLISQQADRSGTGRSTSAPSGRV